jgi:hypothetical protein
MLPAKIGSPFVASDGNTLKDLSLIGALEKWHDAPPRDSVGTIRIIRKNGEIYKNAL